MTFEDRIQIDLNWVVGNVIEQIEFDKQSQSWHFAISSGITLTVHCPWKIVSGEKVALSSGDHGQKYGLSYTIDAVAKANDLLARRKIRNIVSDKITSDLTIDLEGSVILRTFSVFRGFEAWHLTGGPQNIELIGQGNGNIIVFPPNKRQ